MEEIQNQQQGPINKVREFFKGAFYASLFVLVCILATIFLMIIFPPFLLVAPPIFLGLTIWLLVKLSNRGTLNSYRITGIVIGPVILLIILGIAAKLTIFSNGLWG